MAGAIYLEGRTLEVSVDWTALMTVHLKGRKMAHRSDLQKGVQRAVREIKR